MQGAQVIIATGVPTTSAAVVTVQPTVPVRSVPIVRSFNSSLSRTLGGLQLLMALISFGAAIMAVVVWANYYFVGDGFWCGAFFLISGSLALDAGRLPTKRRIKSAMAFAFISLAFAAVEFGVSLAGLIQNIDYETTQFFQCCWWGSCYICQYDYPEMEAANGLLVAASGLQMLMDVVEFAICRQAMSNFKDMVQPNRNDVVVQMQPATVTISDPNQQLQRQQQQQQQLQQLQLQQQQLQQQQLQQQFPTQPLQPSMSPYYQYQIPPDGSGPSYMNSPQYSDGFASQPPPPPYAYK